MYIEEFFFTNYVQTTQELLKHFDKELPSDIEEYEKHLAEVVRKTTQQEIVVSSGHLKYALDILCKQGLIPHLNKQSLVYRLKRVTPTNNKHLASLPNKQLKTALETYTTQELLPRAPNYNSEKQYVITWDITYQHDHKAVKGIHQTPHYYNNPNNLTKYLEQRTNSEIKLTYKNRLQPLARITLEFRVDDDMLL